MDCMDPMGHRGWLVGMQCGSECSVCNAFYAKLESKKYRKKYWLNYWRLVLMTQIDLFEYIEEPIKI